MNTKIKWGESIFLGMGPAVYLGFLAPVIIAANPISVGSIAFILLCCAALSAVYYLVSLAALKAHEKWDVPRMRQSGTYDYFAKYGWVFALCISIPATYMGFFSVAMTYGCPGGHPEFNIFSAIGLYLYGWFIGAAPGAVAGCLFVAVLGFIGAAFKRS